VVIPPARRPRSCRALAAAALAAVLGLGLSAASATSAAGAAQLPSRRVVVVGDSIILGAKPPLVAAFGRQGWATTFDAEVGRSTIAGADAVRRHGPELTDTLVVSLGANDAGSTATFRQRVDAVLAAAAGVPHVYWLTIREVRPYYAPANDVLRAAAAAHPNLRLIDWNGASAGSTGLTASDGLHLTGAGATALASLVASEVLTGPAAAPPVPTTTVTPTTAPPTTLAATPAPVTPSVPAATAPPSTVPSTTVATTTTTPGSGRSGRRPVDAAEVAATDGVGLGWLGWSVGFGLAAVVVLLAVAGAWIAIWSLLRTRGRADPPTDPDGRSARARLRAEHIAAARGRHPTGLPVAPPVDEPATAPVSVAAGAAAVRES
jgi:lysophospholipase L1-like esterase